MVAQESRAWFEEEWPGISIRLERFLISRAVRSPEDIVQETAVRMFQAWNRIDHSRPLWPFVSTVAINVARDELRQGKGREVLGDPPEEMASVGTEEATLARLEFQRVCTAMTKLNDGHRRVLLDELTSNTTERGRTKAAANMVKLRARRRLTAIVEGMSVALIGLRFRVQRSGGEAVHPIAGAIVTAMVAGSLVIPTGLGPQLQEPNPNLRSLMTTSDTRRALVIPEKEKKMAPGITTANLASTPDGNEPGAYRPVRVPVGGVGHIGGEARVEAAGITVRVSDNGGPIPACIDGFSSTPRPLECPDPRASDN